MATQTRKAAGPGFDATGSDDTATNPETGTTSQGETLDEALTNLREATELYLEEFALPPVGRSIITTFEVAVDA